MASRIIHLAITGELLKQYEFQNADRLRFGVIIPDGAANRSEQASSHFKIRIGSGEERTYDLTGYRNMFHKKMETDDLYLGYYLHLIQDLLYRRFVYGKYHWDPKPEGNLERLYDDYRQINARLIGKYEMRNNISVPVNFEAERLNEAAIFDTAKFMKELSKDFEPVEYKERFFFTNCMVDEYIQWAVHYCKKELQSFRDGQYYFDEYEWSWGK